MFQTNDEINCTIQTINGYILCKQCINWIAIDLQYYIIRLDKLHIVISRRGIGEIIMMPTYIKQWNETRLSNRC